MGPARWDIWIVRVGKSNVVRRVIRPAALPPGGTMLYRDEERLYCVPRPADYRESLAWQGYWVEDERGRFPLAVAFGLHPPVAGWEAAPRKTTARARVY